VAVSQYERSASPPAPRPSRPATSTRLPPVERSESGKEGSRTSSTSSSKPPRGWARASSLRSSITRTRVWSPKRTPHRRWQWPTPTTSSPPPSSMA
jgi:hypothetical protein